jgi:hypothetical protein
MLQISRTVHLVIAKTKKRHMAQYLTKDKDQ